MSDLAIPYRVEAFNTAKSSENRIHDDSVARRFGFTGGLVPGVDVYAYMAHPPVARWGRAWLERGTAECRFGKPVYDGAIAEVTELPTSAGMDIRVESGGVECATGSAALPANAAASPDLADWRETTPPTERPPASPTSLAQGTWLSIRPLHLTEEFVANYLRDVRETDPLFAREKLAHPGLFPRCGNWALSHNVVLGPWIHVGSKVQHYGVARVGETLTVRAQVTANYEHKGHLFVELDMLVLNPGPVARIAHTAIYLPRQVANG